MCENILLIYNATGEQRFVTLDEAAAIARVHRKDLECQLERHGRCNTIDYTVLDTLQAKTVAG